MAFVAISVQNSGITLSQKFQVLDISTKLQISGISLLIWY
jgi:hypothetical protein